MGWQMKSLQNEPKPTFIFWDYLAIFVTADLSSSGLVTLFIAGNIAGGTWLLVFSVLFWYLHESHVREQVRKGIR